MPAFNYNDPVAAAFLALVEPWLRERNPSTAEFAQMHYALDGLQYLLTADRSGVNLGAEYRRAANVVCSAPGCHIHAGVPDACLLNYARPGDPPLWFCRVHHPRVEGLNPPGWTPPRSVAAERERITALAWSKLTPPERSAINRNIVSVAERASD